jgi:hypothetical protein
MNEFFVFRGCKYVLVVTCTLVAGNYVWNPGCHSKREVRMSVESCSVHVQLSVTLQNTSPGNSCGTATPFLYSTETGQRKNFLNQPLCNCSDTLFTCLTRFRIWQWRVKNRSLVFVKVTTNMLRMLNTLSLTGSIYRTYLRNFTPEFTE